MQYLAVVASDLLHSSLLSTNAWPRSFDKKVSGFVICEERDGRVCVGCVCGVCVWGGEVWGGVAPITVPVTAI